MNQNSRYVKMHLIRMRRPTNYILCHSCQQVYQKHSICKTSLNHTPPRVVKQTRKTTPAHNFAPCHGVAINALLVGSLWIRDMLSF